MQSQSALCAKRTLSTHTLTNLSLSKSALHFAVTKIKNEAQASGESAV
jgi:hypothetical protein